MDKSHQSCPAKAKDFCDFKVCAVFISNISELCRVKLAYLVRILADLPVGWILVDSPWALGHSHKLKSNLAPSFPNK